MKIAYFVRKIVRMVFAIYFWLRPVIEVCHMSLPSSWVHYYTRLSPDIFLLLFITYYSLLSEDGWLSVAYDLIYIYFWPLFVIWFIVKHTTIRAYHAVKRTSYFRNLILPSISAAQTKIVLDANAESVTTDKKRFSLSLIGSILRPFTQFFLLWSLLLLNTSNVILTWIALAVILFGAVTIIRTLSLFLSDADSWITKLKSNFAAQVANNIAIVRSYKNSQDDTKSRNAANALLLYESTFRYMFENKDRFARWTIIASILVTVPLYLYLSFIFTSIYLGVAHLNHISWPWTDALTTSIFIPFAFADLPHNIWIRLIGGCQALIVTVLGYTVLFRRMQSSVQQLSEIAGELSTPLSDQNLKDLLLVIKTPSVGTKPLGET